LGERERVRGDGLDEEERLTEREDGREARKKRKDGEGNYVC